MNCIAVKDLKTPRVLRARLEREAELLLLNNGKPMAVLLHVGPAEDPETMLGCVREARARLALSRIRESARRRGAARLGMAAINAEIRAVRAARKRDA